MVSLEDWLDSELKELFVSDEESELRLESDERELFVSLELWDESELRELFVSLED